MKKSKALVLFGIICGGINVFWWFLSSLIFENNGEVDFSIAEILGYAAMLVAFSLIYFGIRTYRDKHLNGLISFKQAFLNGLIIIGVASLVYVLGWEIYYPNFASGFAELYYDQAIENYKESDLESQELQNKIEELNEAKENYKNPLYRMGITLMEILPLGLIVVLISSLILRRKTLQK